MKREIKFRGKRVDNGEWVYGDLLTDNKSRYIFPPTSGWFEFKEKLCKVIPETIGQYTGLKDKNGKKIYEGDICKVKFLTKIECKPIQRKIVVDEFMWCIDCIGSYGDDIFSINRPHDFEIVGNIHDNPELLKTEEAK